MLRRLVLRPKQAAEAPRVVEAQDLPAVEDQIPVFMRFRAAVWPPTRRKLPDIPR